MNGGDQNSVVQLTEIGQVTDTIRSEPSSRDKKQVRASIQS